MKFVILFQDNPDADPAIRQTHMEHHLAFLARHADEILAAGPLSDMSGTTAGGLWLVEAASAARVEQLVREDPFWPTGLRQAYSLRSWTQVFAEGRRLIEPPKLSQP